MSVMPTTPASSDGKKRPTLKLHSQIQALMERKEGPESRLTSIRPASCEGRKGLGSELCPQHLQALMERKTHNSCKL
jgi:hypothetical protein